MVVDDDRTMLNLYRIILAEMGDFSIEFSTNGRDAVDKYISYPEKPKLIIIDHRMPIMNGFDAMIEILQLDGGTKFIFASADTTMSDLSISMGAAAFLSKPFKIEELMDLINKTIKE